MRESNFSFPVQNRAAVVISSQLYDRRALDTTSPLPLFNSLTHLTYLTSTSPRIRDILTVDGGLERLVRLLREFCASPPPPQSPRTIYGLKPPLRRQSRGKNKGKQPAGSLDWLSERPFSAPQDQPSSSSVAPAPNPLTSFDRAAAFRFSLAFQCVVNIGVRGSEAVRARVVQAGMLDVVSSVLECWLVSKGFAVCPSPTGSGAPRESREVRVARRMELMERRQRETGAVPPAELTRALQRLPSSNFSTTTARPTERSSDAESQASRIPVRTAGTTIRIRHHTEPRHPPPAQPPATVEEPVFMDVTPPAGQEAQSSGSVSAAEDDQNDDVMDTTEEDDSQGLRRRDTIRGPVDPSVPFAAAGPSRPAISDPSSSTSISSTTSLPVPVPSRRPAIPFSHSSSSGNISDSVSAETSANATPAGGNTPTGSVTIEAQVRERSGTVVGRPVWDTRQTPGSPSRRARGQRHRPQNDTGTEDEAGTEGDEAEGAPRIGATEGMNGAHPARMAVIVQADGSDGAGMEGMNMIVDQQVGMGGVEQGLVNLDMQANDDLAMGAPPGAPGAVPTTTPQQQQQQQITGTIQQTPRQLADITPRPTVAALANATPTVANTRQLANGMDRGATVTAGQGQAGGGIAQTPPVVLNGLSGASSIGSPSASGALDDQSAGPYREEDVLLSLQLLAYLSKYPHVRQAFYKTRTPLGPPLVAPLPPRSQSAIANLRAGLSAAATTIINARSGATSETRSITTVPSIPPTPQPVEHAPNVFSLVERFTFRPSPSETHLPRLPPEIQYWAGVIMRNACRKDETRGGIRQCANMVCGKWESYPREFAKCRRCRKAKYCGKECQSKAWADGHRFWCSSRDQDTTETATVHGDEGSASAQNGAGPSNPAHAPTTTTVTHIERGTTIIRTGPIRRDRAPIQSMPAFLQEQRRLGNIATTAGPIPRTARPGATGTQTQTQTQTVAQPGQTGAGLVVRVTPAQRPTATGWVATTEAPRPRIVQRAVPPNAPGPMEIERRPGTTVRRRADTLPLASGPNGSSAPDQSRDAADVMSRQTGLLDMVSQIASERQRLGMPPLRGLDSLRQDIERLVANVELGVPERSAAIWRMVREFDRLIEEERVEDMRAARRSTVDEDGDSSMIG